MPKKMVDVPNHVAIIMDGNGRWAKKRGLPRNVGHKKGAEALNKIARHAADIGIKILTVYAFSTENWKRPQSEIDGLFALLAEYLGKADGELKDKNVKIQTIGDLSPLPEKLQKDIRAVEYKTKDRDGLILNVAFNYGGRMEIVHAVKNIAAMVKNGQVDLQDIDEQLITDNLYTKNIPDPDLIIRPSGEFRLSNFLLWQSSYSEFWFENILWPDFSEKDFDRAIASLSERERRYGGHFDS